MIGLIIFLFVSIAAILAYYDEKEVMAGRQYQWNKDGRKTTDI